MKKRTLICAVSVNEQEMESIKNLAALEQRSVAGYFRNLHLENERAYKSGIAEDYTTPAPLPTDN